MDKDIEELFNITPEERAEQEAKARAENGGFLYKEAFCLMYYENKETKSGFMIWNSRDGVTPFIVFEDGVEYQHQWWFMDRRITNQVFVDQQLMVPGQRIFRDTTPEEAKEFAVRRLQSAKGTEYEVEEGSDRWNELIESLTKSFTGEPAMVKI